MIVHCANCGKEFKSEELGDGFCSNNCREATNIKVSEERYRRRFNLGFSKKTKTNKDANKNTPSS